MTEIKHTKAQAGFWKADRDQYYVDTALRDEETGQLSFPVPESMGNRWVIIREIVNDEDPVGLPSPVLVGEFTDSETAERVCELIIGTAPSRDSAAVVRLFAAAPKLLAACKYTLGMLEMSPEKSDEAELEIEFGGEPLATLREAIAEAEFPQP